MLNGSTEEGIALGESGDISIFSWRKFLPLYDGGQLVINNLKLISSVPCEKAGLLLSLKIAKNTFERLFEGRADRGAPAVILNVEAVFNPGPTFG